MRRLTALPSVPVANIYAAHCVAVMHGTTTVFADKAYRVRIINHHQRIVFIGQITDAFQIGTIDAIR